MGCRNAQDLAMRVDKYVELYLQKIKMKESLRRLKAVAKVQEEKRTRLIDSTKSLEELLRKYNV